ncbi:hypothetical protein [Micromonospora sp. NPDC001898]|uniref:hypothetical protein n=1 Tax=Micromonospora sp. NPDC001898 TaxID=3364221 RepID=UPI0036C43744
MLLNLAYVHLRSRMEHGEKCTGRDCRSGCGFLEFEAWLTAPLFGWDAEQDERVRQRRAALMRGEIPV